MKTTTIPQVLEQLSIDLCIQGVKFDTVTAHGIRVNMQVRFEPAGEKYDEPCVFIEKVIPISTVALFGDNKVLDLWQGTDVLPFLPRSQVEAVEENLLAQMGGNV